MWLRDAVFNLTYSCMNAALYPVWKWLYTSPKCDLIPHECDLLPLNVWPYTAVWMWPYTAVWMWLYTAARMWPFTSECDLMAMYESDLTPPYECDIIPPYECDCIPPDGCDLYRWMNVTLHRSFDGVAVSDIALPWYPNTPPSHKIRFGQ
jgi:hypothetical protein